MSYLVLLEREGFALRRPFMEKVEPGLWALRPEYANVEYRCFHTYIHAERSFVVVDVIAKKSDKFKPHDVDRARDRAREVRARYAK